MEPLRDDVLDALLRLGEPDWKTVAAVGYPCLTVLPEAALGVALARVHPDPGADGHGGAGSVGVVDLES